MPLELVYAVMMWCAARVLTQERGPWRVFARLRGLAGIVTDEFGNETPTNEFGYLVACLPCTSLWIALIPTLALGQPLYWILWYSGVSVLLHLLTQER